MSESVLLSIYENAICSLDQYLSLACNVHVQDVSAMYEPPLA